MSSENLTSAFYSRWSNLYSFLFDHAPVVRNLRKTAAEMMELEKGDKVIEIGCGTGANFRYIREKVGPTGKIVGVDISGGMLEKARRKIEKNNWNNIELVQGDGAEVEISDEFDAVLFSFSINMFQNPEEIVEKWSNNIKNGRIVNMHGSEATGTFAVPINTLGKVFTILSTPPTFKFRYEETLSEEIEENIQKTHESLKKVSEDFQKRQKLSGIVEIDCAEIEEKREVGKR